MDVARLQQRLKDAGFYSFNVDGLIGRRTYAALFASVARKDLGDMGLAIGDGCVAYFEPNQLNTGLRIAHFLAQTATETGGFARLEENLNYSANRLMQVWPGRFPTRESTAGFANAPQALANKVYGGRLGNGPASSNDGWNFRGRGLIQLTGRTNYTARAAETGVALVDHPELASDPKSSVQIAALYWTARRINDDADRDDIVAVRKKVNGGTVGIEDAKVFLARAKKVLL